MSQSPLDQVLGLPGSVQCTDPQNPFAQSSCGSHESSVQGCEEEAEDDHEDVYNDNIDYYEDDDDDVHSDLYGDFSVSTKAPRSRPAPASQRTATTAYLYLSRNGPKSKGVRPIPPEILHLIFSYVDHTTLYRISRVSRQFHAISKHHIDLVGTWAPEEEDSLLEKLRSGSVNVLKISYLLSSTQAGSLLAFGTWKVAWKRFLGLITEPIHRNKTSSDNPSSINILTVSTKAMTMSESLKPPCLLDAVKKVIVNDAALPDLLPYLHRIHALEIHDHGSRGYHDAHIHLKLILETCSGLDTLAILGYDYQKMFICWDKNATTATEEARPTKFRLTRFSTSSRAAMSCDTIKSFLTACPDLNYFKANDVDIQENGATHHLFHFSDVRSRPLESVYRQAALLCPKLEYFSFTPANSDYADSLETQLALTAELFPQMQHLDVDMRQPYDWSPEPKTAKFLAQLRSIEYGGSAEDLDRLLRHCRMLTHLKSVNTQYKRYVCSSTSSGRSPNETISWRCPQLRTLDLRVYHLATAEEDEDLFRFLGHACPNLLELSLHVGKLRVGQEELIVSTSRMPRTVTKTVARRKLPSTYTVTEDIRTESWKEHKNLIRMLGRFTRLERLSMYVDKVPRVLYPSNFAFLWAGSHDGRGRDGAKEDVYCPRLQSIRIRCEVSISFGKAREEPLNERQFVNALRTMRPEVAIAFK